MLDKTDFISANRWFVVAIGIPRDSENLVNHPHLCPVILELVAAVQANHIVLAGGGRHVPIRVDGASHGDR